jgi:ribonuclease HI
MKTVHIFTDGSCRGNPGPGGWAFLLRCIDGQGRGHERAESGAVLHTTNNRMEIETVIPSG